MKVFPKGKYRVVSIKNGIVTVLTTVDMTWKEASTIAGKFTPYPGRKIRVQKVSD